jgi:NADH-quinone oxidoreductase subunit L
MLVPLAVLAVGALAAGFLFEGSFIGEGMRGFWREAVAIPNGGIMDAMHRVSAWVSWTPTLLMVIGFALAWYMYISAPGSAERLAAANPLLYKFLLNKWYFDELYDVLFVRPAFKIGRLFWKGGDGRIIDGMGPDGVAARVRDVTNQVVRLQSGYLYHYAFAMLIGVAALITWYVVGGVR